MKTRSRRISIRTLALLLLGGALSAQGVNHTPPMQGVGAYSVRAAPMTVDIVDPGQAVSGDLDGDLSPDFAWVDRNLGTASVLLSPGLMERLKWQVSSAVDVGVLSTRDERDYLLVVNGSGLQRLDLTVPGWDRTTLAASWAGVQQIETYSPEEGETEVFGLDGDGHTLLHVHCDGGEVLVDEVLFSVPLEVLAIEPYRRNGTGEVGLAVMTHDTLALYDLSGNLLRWIVLTAYGWTCDAIAAMSHGGAAQDWIAWVATAADGTTQYLVIANEAGPLPAKPVWTNIDVSSISDTDYDLDGDDDLVFTFSDAYHAVRLNNEGEPTPDFRLQDKDLFYAPGGMVQYGRPYYGVIVPADVDSDGDEDLLQATINGRLAVFVNSDGVDEELMKVEVINTLISSGGGTPGLPARAWTTGHPTHPGNALELDVLPPSDYDGANRLEVKVFRQEGPGEETDPTVFFTDYIDITESFPPEVEIDLPDGSPGSDRLYYVTLRCVLRQGGETVEVNPATIDGTHLSAWPRPDTCTPYLLDMAGGDESLYDIDHEPGCGPDRIGRGLLVPCVPGMDDILEL